LVSISVPAPNHFWLSWPAAKSRLIRSGARHRPFPGRVVHLRLRFCRAARPNSPIKPATVLLLTRQPASRRSAVIRGDPYLPACSANSRLISALSRSWRCARGGSAPPRHL